MQHGLCTEDMATALSHCSNAVRMSSSVVFFTLFRRSLMSENGVLFEDAAAVSDMILPYSDDSENCSISP